MVSDQTETANISMSMKFFSVFQHKLKITQRLPIFCKIVSLSYSQSVPNYRLIILLSVYTYTDLQLSSNKKLFTG